MLFAIAFVKQTLTVADIKVEGLHMIKDYYYSFSADFFYRKNYPPERKKSPLVSICHYLCLR